MGYYDYRDKYNNGIFMKHCKDNKLTDFFVFNELIQKKYKITIKSVKFDENFPFGGIPSNNNKNPRIFQILKYCVVYKPSLPRKNLIRFDYIHLY